MSYKVHFLFIFLSIAIKIFAFHFTNFDLFGDEAQYWLWSKTPELGYYSKPPLLAWMLNLHTYIFGNSFVALKYFSFFLYFLTSYVVFLLSFELFQNKKLALYTALSFYLLPSVSVSSFLISTDVVLIFFFSLSLLLLLKIRKRPSIYNFIVLGIFLGLSFLTKYAAIYYFISFFLIIILDKQIRKSFDLKNSLLLALCFILVLFPNIIWNIQNSWVTFSHTSDNASLNNISFSLVSGFNFLLSQIAMLGPLLIFFFIVQLKKIEVNFQTKFLLSFSLPVFFIVFIESVLVRANANWAAVALIPFFILAITHIYNCSKKIILYNNLINFMFCMVFFILISFSSNIRMFDRISGVSDFAKNLNNVYLQNGNYLIVEDRLLFSSLSYYLRDFDIKILTPFKPSSEIKSHFQITKPLKQKHSINFFLIGDPKSIKYLNKKFNFIKREELNVKFKKQPIAIYEVTF